MKKSGTKIPENYVTDLREMAIRGLVQMYKKDEKSFIFCMRRTGNSVLPEGNSRRYTAITLIGLAGEKKEIVKTVLAGNDMSMVLDTFKKDLAHVDNLGDIALFIWAACDVGYKDRKQMWDRLFELQPIEKVHPTVELSWALDAACRDSTIEDDTAERLAKRLMTSFNAKAGVFPHIIGKGNSGLRSHVSCFADMVYPIHALSNFAKKTGNQQALDQASKCAELICQLQGPEGQWWWHYDWRTGDILEGYPVYSVHQDAMAPMALFVLKDAGGPDFSKQIMKGLEWLAYSPEINASLVDKDADLIWRKVARHEPGKLSRYLQAAASNIHPSLRAPGLNVILPPGAIDYENRPYHLGWLLYAWPESRAIQWDKQG